MGSTPIAGTNIRDILHIRRRNMNALAPQLLMLAIFIGAMYFFLIRPQKKKEKEIQAMRSNLSVGDEIITIGGIHGKIVKTKDDSIVIQVGADKVKFEMTKWSVSSVVSSAKAKKDEPKEEKKIVPKKLKKAESAEKEAAEETEKAAEETSENK